MQTARYDAAAAGCCGDAQNAHLRASRGISERHSPHGRVSDSTSRPLLTGKHRLVGSVVWEYAPKQDNATGGSCHSFEPFHRPGRS